MMYLISELEKKISVYSLNDFVDCPSSTKLSEATHDRHYSLRDLC